MNLRANVQALFKDGAIYGLSKVIGQLISFFLIPLYTKYLSPEDYAVLSLVGILSVSFTLFSSFALDSTAYRFVGLMKTYKYRIIYASSAHTLIILTSLILGAITLVCSGWIAKVLFDNANYSLYVSLGIFGAIAGTLSTVPTAYFRILRKAKFVGTSLIINLSTSILSTILLVVVFKFGVTGALLGNLIGNLASTIFLSVSAPIWKFTFSLKINKKLIAYAAPIFPHKVLAFLFPVYSQLALKEYTSLKEVGYYAIAWKFCTPFMLFIGTFQQAWSPYKFEILRNQPNPQATFSKLFNIYVLISGTLFLISAGLGSEVLKFTTPSNFHDSAKYVPYLALIPLIQGMYFMLGTGQEFSKSPKILPLISGCGLIAVLISCTLLIPSYAVAGLGLSMAIGWLVMAIGTYIYSNSLYKIPYNWKLVFVVFLLFLALGFIFNRFDGYINRQTLYIKIFGIIVISICISLLIISPKKILTFIKSR
ncbi:MAG: oligosaccharide flippase family protein [Bacteroidota bacterium]